MTSCNEAMAPSIASSHAWRLDALKKLYTVFSATTDLKDSKFNIMVNALRELVVENFKLIFPAGVKLTREHGEDTETISAKDLANYERLNFLKCAEDGNIVFNLVDKARVGTGIVNALILTKKDVLKHLRSRILEESMITELMDEDPIEINWDFFERYAPVDADKPSPNRPDLADLLPDKDKTIYRDKLGVMRAISFDAVWDAFTDGLFGRIEAMTQSMRSLLVGNLVYDADHPITDKHLKGRIGYCGTCMENATVKDFGICNKDGRSLLFRISWENGDDYDEFVLAAQENGAVNFRDPNKIRNMVAAEYVADVLLDCIVFPE